MIILQTRRLAQLTTNDSHLIRPDGRPGGQTRTDRIGMPLLSGRAVISWRRLNPAMVAGIPTKSIILDENYEGSFARTDIMW
jgi:hypothetical protein